MDLKIILTLQGQYEDFKVQSQYNVENSAWHVET